jgi:hypothetical protein
VDNSSCQSQKALHTASSSPFHSLPLRRRSTLATKLVAAHRLSKYNSPGSVSEPRPAETNNNLCRRSRRREKFAGENQTLGKPRRPPTCAQVEIRPCCIAAKLDAEEWRDLVGAYIDAASAAVVEMGGKVAKKLGEADGAVRLSRGAGE